MPSDRAPTSSLRVLRSLTVALFALAVPATGAAAQDLPADTAGQGERELLKEGLPLEPGRTVSFTATEGSWMSVDVSPDGTTLLFDLLGDIYTMPIEGGVATQVTRGMGYDAMPRFSPDGESIVYVSDRDGGENLWLLSLDMADTTQLTRGGSNSYLSPEWTPDGEYVVATRGSKLWMWHRDGGSGVELISEPGNLRTIGAAFGADDRYIWFSGRVSQGSLYNNGLDLYQLARYDRDTGEITSESSRFGGAFRPTLSPDGRWLVYGSRHIADTGLRIRDLATGDERWLAWPVQRDDQESASSRDVYPGMAFTPDSEAVIAFYGGGLWRVPVDGSEPTGIPFEIDVDLPIGPLVDFDYPIEDTPTFTAKQIRDAVPSPSGDRLAFTVLNELWVQPIPDGEPMRLAGNLGGVQQHPTWSPDGRWIAFSRWTDDEAGGVYRVRSTGGTAERLTTEAALWRFPKWSPDGTRILVDRAEPRLWTESIQRGNLTGPSELVWIPAAGGEATVVGGPNVSEWHFTNDPDRIFAYTFGDGLVSMRWDGTDVRPIVRVRGRSSAGGGTGQNASTIWMAPEGNLALAQVVYDLYVVTVPRVGGDEAPLINVANPDNATFPAWKLTDIGAQFPVWSADGRTVHWSIGNAHVMYDLDDMEAFVDSVAAAREAEEAEDAADADDADAADDTDADAEETDEDAEAEDEESETYEPVEFRIEIPFDRDLHDEVAVLRNARIVTMDGDRVIERGDLVIRGTRIAAVGPAGSVEVPAGADEIDMTGKTIVPGFVDTHAHLRASYGFHRPQPWSYVANLAFGVTVARDPQTGSTDVLSYEDMVRSGRMLGPRIYSTGPGVFSSENVSSLDHARDVMRRYAEYYDTKTIKMYGAGNREQRQWIIEAARELELMPTTEGGLDLWLNLTMAQDGYSGIEHNLPGVPLYEDVVQLMAQSLTATTPTLLVTYGGPWAENFFYATEDVLGNEKLVRFTPFEDLQQRALRRPGPTGAGNNGWFREDQYPFPLISDFVDRVVEEGGRAGVGSRGQLQGLGWHWELWAMAAGDDVTPMEALRMATILGAESLGLDQDLGSIEAGKLADLVVLDSNPLDDLRNTLDIHRVILNGRIRDGDTLDEVWPRQQAVGPFYWQAEPAIPAPAAGIGN